MTIRQLIDLGYDLDAPLYYSDSVGWYPLSGATIADEQEVEDFVAVCEAEEWDADPMPVGAVILS